MSSSLKSKSKDKRAAKDQKVSSKSSATVNGTSGLPASAYNPVLGTFLTLEASPISSLTALHVNGRFRNIDETDDNSGITHLSGGDYDSASNNDSHSVESEEHKDKASGRPEVIPGADNDKRDKIRQKNERKHQRQKEKRAQELHDRCSGYLMSRKLESLSQKLVSMGFPAEQSTMALILNEGILEEAVSWLTEDREGSDKNKDQNVDSGSNLKIDISEELAQIAEMEVSFKCSKQEVERAVVACEGDIMKAKESLQEQKQDPPGLPDTAKSVVRVQQKPSSVSMVIPSATKSAVTAPKIAQPTKIQQKLEWAKPQRPASVSLASSPPPPNKVYGVAMTGGSSEQVVMMQRPQQSAAVNNNTNGALPYRSVSDVYQHQHQQFGPIPVEMQGRAQAQAQSTMWKRAGSSPALAVASSLGLFSWVGSTCSSGSSSPVDWHTGGTMSSSCDYTNIDWSLDRTFLPSMSSKPPTNPLWQGPSYHHHHNHPNTAAAPQNIELRRPPSSNGNGVSMGGFQNGGSGIIADKASAGSREWTSPFEGNDLFSSHRQFVSSPSR